MGWDCKPGGAYDDIFVSDCILMDSAWIFQNVHLFLFLSKEVSENKKLIVAENGNVFIEPLNGAPGERQQIGTIGTSLGGSKEDPLIKSLDGHLRLSSGGVPGADQAAVLSQGFLEGSNIDAVSELIGTMEDQRQFEINIKLISLSKEIDEGGSSIMRLPS